MPRKSSALIPMAFAGLCLAFAPAKAQAQPAPPLIQLQSEFLSTGSPNVWDIVPVGGFSTKWDHYGPTLLVGVLETGYASTTSRVARFNGVNMKFVKSEAQYRADRKVWGYLVYYRYDGPWVSGNFTYQATSLVFPYKTLTQRIYVQ